MTAPKKIFLDGYDFFFWEYQYQTKMKHLVLSKYITPWSHKLGKFNPKICFVDCHGGSGAYVDEQGIIDWGSAVKVAAIARNINDKYRKNIRILVYEKDRKTFENLNSVILFNKCNDLVECRNSEFEELLTKQNADKFRSMPSLFFVDPCGYSIDMNVFRYMLQFPRCEVVFNFMFMYINRSISIESEEEKMNCLFGCDEWKEARNKHNDDRELFLVSLFKRKLKEITGVKYVFPYRISTYDKDRTYYYLFHMSNHYDGCSIMKQCFASCNNGKVEYLGKRSDIYTLFDLNDFKTSEVADNLYARYKGLIVSVERLMSESIDDTLFLESDIKKALKILQADGKVEKIMKEVGRPTTFKSKDLARFV